MLSTTSSSRKMIHAAPGPASAAYINPVHAGIFRHTLKRFAWLSGAYFLALFLMLPLRAMMTLSEIKETDFFVQTFERMYNFNSEPFQIILMIMVPFFTALLVFHYLQNAAASDFHHGLPVSRNTYYWTQITAGWTIIILPVVVIGFMSLLLQQLTAMGQYLSLQEVGIWLGTTVLMNTVFYLSTVVVGMFTGVVLVQGIFTFILLFLPAGLFLLTVYNLESLVWGFNGTNQGIERFAQFSPLVRLVELTYEPLRWKEVTGYGIFILLLVIAAHWLYRHRRLERNGQTIVFKGLNYLFLFGITFCAMLLGGLYAYMINGRMSWLLVAYGVFSLIGYTIARAVLNKSLRIFNWEHYRAYGLYLGLAALLMVGIHTDIAGFEKRIPALDQIQGAYAGNFPYFWYHGSDQAGLYVTPENQEQVRQIHAAILANEPRRGAGLRDDRNITLFYHLNNGKVMARQYAVNWEDYEAYLNALKESEEDKQLTYPVLSLSPGDLNQIMLESHELQKVTYIQDPDEMAEFLALVQQEILEASNKELQGWPPKGDIWFRVKASVPETLQPTVTTEARYSYAIAETIHGSPEVHVYRLPAFQRVETWLKEKGYYDQGTVTAADIHQVVVQRVSTEEEMQPIYNTWNLDLQQSLIVEEWGAIEESLALYSSSWMNREAYPVYLVGFYDQNGRQMFMGTFDENFLPDFVRQHPF